MKDLLIRILVSAVVGAITSAGILYFAFDQSMRGLESAIESTNERISDNSEWLRTIKIDINSVETKLDVIGDKISNSIHDGEIRGFNYALSFQKLQQELATSVALTASLADHVSTLQDIDPNVVAQLKTLSEQLLANSDAIQKISFGTE